MIKEARWHVVAFDPNADPEETVWTVSLDPTCTGWNTDGGYPDYGLTKAQALELADAANVRCQDGEVRNGPFTFYGKPSSELSRNELMDVISYLTARILAEEKSHQETLSMMKLVGKL